MDDGRELRLCSCSRISKIGLFGRLRVLRRDTWGLQCVAMAREPRVLAAAETISVSEIPKLRRPGRAWLRTSRDGNCQGARHCGHESRPARRANQNRAQKRRARGCMCWPSASAIMARRRPGLALQFAHKDAEDAWRARFSTRKAAASTPGSGQRFMRDGCDRASNFQAPQATERNMARGSGQDMAVVLFAGHGAVIGDQFYRSPMA